MPGKANRYWAWYQELPAEWGNWNFGVGLAAMHFRQRELVAYWTKQLLLVLPAVVSDSASNVRA